MLSQISKQSLGFGTVVINMVMFNIQVNQWASLLPTQNSLLKVLAFFVAWTIIWMPIAMTILWIEKKEWQQPLTTEQKLPLLASLYLIAPLIVWGAAKIESLSLADYGLECSGKLLISLLLGIALSLISLGTVFWGEWQLGWLSWKTQNISKLVSI